MADQIEKDGGELIADYGTFQLFEVDAGIARRFERRGAKNEDAQNRISLNAGDIDTSAPERQAQRALAAAFNGKRLRLVQFAGPVKPEWRDALEQTGARIVSYIPNNTYLVYADAGVVGRMQGWARASRHVQWDGNFDDDYKIHPQARRGAALESETPDTDLFAIQLVEDPQANAATLQLIDEIKLAPVVRQFQNLDYLNVIVRLPVDRLADVAARPEVVSIQPYIERQKFDERQNQIIAGNLAGGLPDGPGYLSWLASKGFDQSQFTASGFAVDVSDSGVDRGSTNVGHFGLYQSGQTNLPVRLVYARLEGNANPGSTIRGCDGHGTINAHIIGGFNDQPFGFPHTDAAGYHYGLGVCPFVKIGSSVIFDPETFTSPNYNNLQSRAYNNGARISANSWGAPVSGAYDVDAQNYDRLVRDAQPTGSAFATSGNQEMVIVFAAGNDGSSGQTIGSPGSAKNVITVGASENVHSHSTANGGNNASGNSGCGNDSDLAANNANDMATFSSRGPCSDGRRKPDIVAPGTHITGGVTQTFPPPSVTGTGNSIACYNGEGVCKLPGGGTTGNANNYFPLGQQFYTTSSGTSHSTPAVAGACALLRQYFINQNLTIPSPAMTKAFLMNSARYLNGAGANDSLWSNSQGMGGLNLGFAFDGVSRVFRDQLAPDKFTASGQERVFTGTISTASEPFRVTLAWTDAPGNTVGNAFNNDLDLTVTVGGVTYMGNNFNGAASTPGGSADPRNNVESVFIPAGVSGNIIVTVTAANINSDGVPNEAPSIDQDFALVIYNAVATTFPLMGVTGTAITAENCAVTNSIIDPYETVTMLFALNNTGTRDTTNLVVTLLATNGITPLSGPQSYGVVIAGGHSVTQAFTFTAAGNCGSTLTAVFQLQDGDENLGLLPHNLTFGEVSLAVTSATNGSSIKIPNIGSSGAASPFPSTVSVTGITEPVSKVTVTLRSLSHTFPDDLDILLVGPGGQMVMLMSDCGASSDVSGVTLTFDDAADLSLPDSAQINSGTYKPTDFVFNDTFPSTSLTGPFGASLSVFNGQDPNGTWSLYVQDDTTQDIGLMSQGWSISITTSNISCCAVPVANLALTETASANAVNLGSNVTFTITVTNHGPDTAENVMVTKVLQEGLEFISAVATQGDCTNNAGLVTCVIGSLPPGTDVAIVIETTALTAGNWTNIATVVASTLDLFPADNSASSAVLVNTPPTISEIPDIQTGENTPADPIPFTISDAETPAAALALHAYSSNTNLVPDANIVLGGDETNRTVTVTPSPNLTGNALITIVVSDGLAEVSESFTLSVLLLGTNTAPELSPISDFTVFEGETLSFTNIATDLEVPPQTLTFSLGNGSPQGAQLDSATGVFTWTPTEEQGPATNSITVIVTDNAFLSLSATQAFTVIVLETNAVPALSSIADFVVLEGELLTITNSATDADIPTNTLSFSLAGGTPPAVTIDGLSGLIQWTPDETAGTTTNLLTVIVADDGIPSMSATQTFTVVVLESNSPPTLVAIPDFVLVEGETLSFTNSASDPDIPANALMFTLLGESPTSATLDSTNGVFVWATTEADGPMTNLFTVIVTDDGEFSLTATQTFTVIILETNHPPELPPIEEQIVIEGETLVITNLATDPDIPANTLTFTLATNAHPEIDFDSATGNFKWTPGEEDGPGTNQFTIIVSDDGVPSLSATQTFTVIVLEENTAPTLAFIEDQVVYEGQLLTVANSAGDIDIPANALAFTLGEGIPTGVEIDENSGLIQWTPDESQGSTTNLLTIIVTDNGVPSLSATQTFTVIALESNLPPVLAAIPDRTIYAGSTITFTNSATDSDIPTNSLTFTFDASPATTAIIDATNGLFSLTSAQENTTNTLAITVRVTDDGIPPMFHEQTFHVTVLAGPLIESISVSSDIVTITWSAIDGMAYRLQSISNIFDTNWTDIPPDITAEGPTALHTNTLSTAERYYRVRLLP